jgi:phosphomevalonate kinase
VFAVFVVIGAITLYDQFVTPHMNYFHATQEYALVMGDIAKKTNTIRVVTELKKKKLEELQDKFKHIHTKLFNSVEAEEFFSDIQAIAEQANCIVYSLNFSPINTATEETVQSKVTDNINENCVTLTVAGSYTDIVNLINSLQNRPKQVWTDSISIETIGNSDVLKCELNIRIYVIYDKWRHRND